MTLGRFSILITVVLVAVPFYGAFTTGQAMLTMWILMAPLPSYLVYGVFGEYADWTVGHLVDHLRGEDPVEVDLDAALRPPLPTPGHVEDDGAYFVPDCPPLDRR